MELYHGSNLEVREPQLIAALHTLDFGPGGVVNDDQYSAFLAVLMPDVVGLVARRHGLDEAEATHRFYSSKLYSKLENQKLKLWHYSSETLYALYDEECRSGKLTFPEEAC